MDKWPCPLVEVDGAEVFGVADDDLLDDVGVVADRPVDGTVLRHASQDHRYDAAGEGLADAMVQSATVPLEGRLVLLATTAMTAAVPRPGRL